MFLFQAVKQIGIFMICAQAILHFKPSDKYEKYMKLLISIMVLVQILMPIVQCFSKESSAYSYFFEQVEKIRTEMKRELEQMEVESIMQEETILQEIREEVKTRINKVASGLGLEANYVWGEQDDAQDCLVIYVKEKQNLQDISIHIEPIIGGQKRMISEQNSPEEAQKEEKLRMLRKEISKELKIPEEEIEVLWYES